MVGFLANEAIGGTAGNWEQAKIQIVGILSVAILTHIEIGSFVLFYSYLIFGLARFSMQKIKKNKVIDLET